VRPTEWTGDEFLAALASPAELPVPGSVVLLTGPPSCSLVPEAAIERLTTTPCLVVAAPGCAPDGGLARLADVAVDDAGELDDVLRSVQERPVAARSAALLLRAGERADPRAGLVLESATYSALQAGPEFAAWLASRAAPAERSDQFGRSGDDAPRVRVERDGRVVHVSLSRPWVLNALDHRMRDELLEALFLLEADPELRLVLQGDGRGFCSGGDLSEFGSAPDPASAHLLRLRRSPASVLLGLADRSEARVHGPCAGSGVELAAFAGRVVASTDATFSLPELGLGLVPGAGGSVSLTRRIGRHRCAWLLLTGRTIDAQTARSWGLVDAVGLV